MLTTRTNPEVEYWNNVFKELIDLIPDGNNIQTINNNFAVERIIPLDVSAYIENNILEEHLKKEIIYVWEDAYYTLTRHIAKIMMKTNFYHTIKFIPSIHRYSDMEYSYGHNMSICLRLQAEISVVQSAHAKMYIPEWIYIDNKMTEWRCGHCTTPNEIVARLCTQCGAPRALLIQEMMCSNCGTPKNEDEFCDRCGVDYEQE